MKTKRYLLSVLAVLMSLTAMAQQRDKNLTISVTTGVGESLQGQTVTLEQTDYSLSYGTITLDAAGQASLKVYAGNHRLTVERAGFETAVKEFAVDGDTNVGVTLTEKTRTPFALQALPQHDAYTGDNSVAVSWNTEPPVFFDDFESYDAFAITFGQWTGIDGDQAVAAALLGDYPNRGIMQYAQIINPLAVTPTWWYDYPILRPYSGKQYVGFTRTNAGTANDDWLISPALNIGTENVLSFMAKAADQFPERFMVYVTTVTDQPTKADFVRLDQGNVETVDYKGWQEFSYDLSAYAGQTIKFAIRYVGEYNIYGNFMLMVDDVFVGQPRAKANTAKAQAKSRRSVSRSADNPNEVFHIYLDGNKVGETEDYAYTIANVQPGTHAVGVKAVYKATESALVTANVTVAADGYSHVTFLVTADSKLTADGQTIQLVNTATSETYELTVRDGKAEMASLPDGDYVVNIAEGAFNEYQQTVSVHGDETYPITLTDRILDPYNVTADVTDGADGTFDVVLKWNQELLFSDSFEDYDDFARGSFGDWLTYDIDQQPIYPISLNGSIITFPGSGSQYNPQPLAPMVFNPWSTVPAMLPTDAAVAAPTGDKTIIFFSAQRGQSDKWLISPEMTIREGYAVRATMKSYAAEYPESVDFAISTTGDQPSDFSVISVANNIPAGEWTIYESDLADYAGQTVRLGIHYRSYDTFFLQLDDFTVGPEGGDADIIDYGNVLRYVIYVDGVPVGESTTSEYTLTQLSAGQHTIAIKAFYQSGESQATEIVVNAATGLNVVKATEVSADAPVYTLDGRRVTTAVGGQAALSSLPRGLYIVKQNGQYRKIRK